MRIFSVLLLFIANYECKAGLNVNVDIKEHMLWVKVNGEEVKTKRVPALSHTAVSFKTMVRELKGSEAYYVELGMMAMYYQEVL